MNKLSEIDACIHLGITKGLLYSYVTKKTNGKKLDIILDKNNNFFEKDILNLWDDFLKKPWVSHKTDTRPPISQHIKDYLKVECGDQCARCKNGHPLEDAHINPWSESLSHHHANLIRICSDCHRKYDQGIITKDEIVQLKSVLVEKIKNSLTTQEQTYLNKLQLPDKIFSGRDKELEKVKEWLESPLKSLFIRGIGGIGKTQLTVNSLYKSSRNIYWIDVEKFTNLSDLQNHLNNLFNVSDLNQLFDAITSNDLIVFDGYEKLIFLDNDKANDFLNYLIDYTHEESKFIIISQVEIQNTQIQFEDLYISELPLDETITILNTLTNNLFKNDDKLITVAKHSYGHPLTIRIYGGLIKFFKSAEIVLKKIKELGINVIKDPIRNNQNKSTSLEDCLSISYQQLSNSEVNLIFHISCFPGGITDDFLSILIGNKSDSIFNTNHELDIAIAKLSLFHLIKFDRDPFNQMRITLLNPIRSFIIGKLSENKIKKHEIRILAFESLAIQSYYIYTKLLFSDNIDYGIIKLELELPNYLYAVQRSIHVINCEDCKKHCSVQEYEDLIIQFAGTLYKFLFMRSYFKHSISLNLESAKIEMARNNFNSAIEDLAHVYVACGRSSNNKKANEVYELILECEKKSEIEIKNGTFYLIKGQHIRNKNPNEAIKYFKKGAEFESQNLNNGYNNLASLLSEIGWTYEKNLHNPKYALDFYMKGYELQKNAKDYQNLFCSSHNIGNCHNDLGNINEALKYYDEALFGFIDLQHRQYISNTFSEIGRLKTENIEIDISQILSPEVIMESLLDMEFEILRFLNDNFPDGGVPTVIMKKLFNSIQLVSFSEEGELLQTWADKLLEKTHDNARFILNFLYIARRVGIIIKTRSFYTSDFEDLCILCYMSGNEMEHKLFKPYEWLGSWIDYRNVEFEKNSKNLYQYTEDYLLNKF